MKNRKVLFLFFVLCTLFHKNSFSQRNTQLNREWGLVSEKKNASILLKSFEDSLLLSANKKAILAGITYTNFKPYIVKTSRQVPDTSKRLFARKYREESLFIVRDSSDKFYLTIDPLFNFEGGMDVADSSAEVLIKNTRGFLLRGDIGEKFSFESSFYENQATFAQYIDVYIAETNQLFPETAIVPGQGRSKKFRENGYDFAMASGYISYSPSQYLNIQLGHGKHFIGDGYRSLLLSDNSYNYPYARITTNFKNFQYTNLYTSFMNLTDGGVTTPTNIERLFQKKVGSFQMLSANFFSRLALGVFQGMIWEVPDSTNRQHLKFNTFDPLIGVNTATYGLHNENNILLGATFKIKITNTLSVFGQYVLDDVMGKNDVTNVRSKYGYQIGFKYFDAFAVNNLHLQGEFNSVQPYSYASEKPAQSYTHYNQALAHPLGANFNELVGFLNYRYKRFFVQLKANYAVKGTDTMLFNYGGDVFRSDNTFPAGQVVGASELTQGLKTATMYQDVHLGLLVNPSTNFNIVLGVSNRTFIVDDIASKTTFVYVGIRTSLSNVYYDF